MSSPNTASSPSTTRSVIAALTVHNRRDLTLDCLAALDAQQLDGASLDVVVFDDGSTDGTGSAIAEGHPHVTVLSGDGSFFWNGGMRVALAAATRRDPDFVLWVNDDTMLDEDAVRRLLAVYDQVSAGLKPVIVVGATTDPVDGHINYSGVVQDRVRRMVFTPVHDPSRPMVAESMNGNCVLVPRDVYRTVGNLDPGYSHSMGDYDYGLRAVAAGVEIRVVPGPVGTCGSNPGFQDSTVRPLRDELQRLRTTKYLPTLEWLRFARRWAGPLWPVYWLSPYVQTAIRIVRGRASSAAEGR